jgi:anaerobic magnesium-protoporphyrin IX monomethyl ester cyclase
MTLGKTQTDVVLISMQQGFLPSYGMLYLETFLNKSGISAEIFYPMIQSGLNNDFIRRIIEPKPRIIGIGGLYDDRFAVKKLIKMLEPYRKEFKLVVGGNLVSPIPEYMLRKLSADIAVVGEGEIIFTKLAENILGGKSYAGVGGLVFSDGNIIVSTGPRDYIEDLNTIPPLNYDKIPMEYYVNVFKFYKRNTRTSCVYTPSTRLGAVPTGRSCFFKCNFCYHSNKMRQIAIPNIIEHAKEFKERFNINLLRFVDDLTFINKRQTLEFCKKWMDSRINLNYMISAHFSSIDEEVVLALKENGCVQVGMGLESGSQKILNRIGKKVKLARIKCGLELFNKHNILWNGAVQIGQLGKSTEDVQKTIDFYYPYINERSTVAVCITTPYPGTPLYNYGLSSGLIKNHDEAYNKLRNPRHLSFNFTQMSKWRLYYLRFKLVFMFDITKQIKSRGALGGSWWFLKTLFLKLIRG